MIPESLVEAAAEAIPTRLSTGYQLLAQEKVEIARIALTAAFGALPECDEAELVGGRALIEHYADNPYQTFHHAPSVAGVVTYALAQEFGDKK